MKGELIRELRIEKDMTQVQLAKEIGISESYVRLIELNKRKASYKVAKKFSKFFNIEMESIAPSELLEQKENVVNNLISKLIENGIIKDATNVDQETMDMIVMAVRVEIDKQLKNKKD